MPRRRPSRLSRRQPHREPKARFTLVCEGGSTEPTYFRALERHLGNAVLIQSHAAVGVAFTVAQKSVELGNRKARNSFEDRDQVWAIFDRDTHPDFDKAVNLCEKNGVSLGRSNPCFEVWLILHLENYDKPDGAAATQARLRQLRPEYNPKSGKVPNCSDLMANVEVAEARAATLLKRRVDEGAPFGAPSTTVFELTRELRAAASQGKSKQSRGKRSGRR